MRDEALEQRRREAAEARRTKRLGGTDTTKGSGKLLLESGYTRWVMSSEKLNPEDIEALSAADEEHHSRAHYRQEKQSASFSKNDDEFFEAIERVRYAIFRQLENAGQYRRKIRVHFQKYPPEKGYMLDGDVIPGYSELKDLSTQLRKEENRLMRKYLRKMRAEDDEEEFDKDAIVSVNLKRDEYLNVTDSNNILRFEEGPKVYRLSEGDKITGGNVELTKSNASCDPRKRWPSENDRDINNNADNASAFLDTSSSHYSSYSLNISDFSSDLPSSSFNKYSFSESSTQGSNKYSFSDDTHNHSTYNSYDLHFSNIPSHFSYTDYVTYSNGASSPSPSSYSLPSPSISYSLSPDLSDFSSSRYSTASPSFSYSVPSSSLLQDDLFKEDTEILAKYGYSFTVEDIGTTNHTASFDAGDYSDEKKLLIPLEQLVVLKEKITAEKELFTSGYVFKSDFLKRMNALTEDQWNDQYEEELDAKIHALTHPEISSPSVSSEDAEPEIIAPIVEQAPIPETVSEDTVSSWGGSDSGWSVDSFPVGKNRGFRGALAPSAPSARGVRPGVRGERPGVRGDRPPRLPRLPDLLLPTVPDDYFSAWNKQEEKREQDAKISKLEELLRYLANLISMDRCAPNTLKLISNKSGVLKHPLQQRCRFEEYNITPPNKIEDVPDAVEDVLWQRDFILGIVPLKEPTPRQQRQNRQQQQEGEEAEENSSTTRHTLSSSSIDQFKFNPDSLAPPPPPEEGVEVSEF
eukprot:TRINITY_DN2995_c0_g1_i4.p1 TRINITY_DN2995_c0_g1~~TRINITY_DN2995_c0_g1_i4.p1  ORF type:complete len:747 (-),score=206.22 TRINITY_DN2995_c0_g1_i4:36-2276(-)